MSRLLRFFREVGEKGRSDFFSIPSLLALQNSSILNRQNFILFDVHRNSSTEETFLNTVISPKKVSKWFPKYQYVHTYQACLMRNHTCGYWHVFICGRRRSSTAYFGLWPSGCLSLNHLNPSIAFSSFSEQWCVCQLNVRNAFGVLPPVFLLWFFLWIYF